VSTLELTEGVVHYLEARALTESDALAISASNCVDMAFPSPLNGRRFVLRPTTVVGLVPITRDLMIRIAPKVPVANLFGMLEIVHGLSSFKLYSGIGQVDAVEQIYARVAALLARGVMRRVRKGLYASYMSQEERSLVARGRLDIVQSMRFQWRGSIQLHCSYEMQTIDNDENRILLWALDRIPRLGLTTGGAVREVRSARRALLGSVSLVEMHPRDCVNRLYSRLNADYALLHALARFFLEHMGPGLAAGDHNFLPFTVDMAILFQEYIVCCLRLYAPRGLLVARQYSVELSGDFRVRFSMDAVIKDESTGDVLAVVDAKYKKDVNPSSSDVEQVIAYAAQTGATRAFLVYPFALPVRRVPVGAGHMKVVTVGVALDSDLARAARTFASLIFGESISVKT
jgi:5-methylcytosine-specific restriction enzyme subunit McrC